MLYSSICHYIKYTGDDGNVWFTHLLSIELNSSRFKLNLTGDNCTAQLTITRSLYIVAVNLSALFEVTHH